MGDCNIRNVPEELMISAKRAALDGGKTLREWVIGVMEGALSEPVKQGKVLLERSEVTVAVEEAGVAVMEGERLGKECAKHGDKWCVECG